MDRAFESGAAGSAPTAPASPSVGYPTAGNPGTGTPPTKPGPWWFHMVTEELRAIITAAGLTPTQGTIDQVLQALPNALASRPEMAKSLSSNGYQKLPGGLIIQWGTTAGTDATGYVAQTLPITFPNSQLGASAVYSAGSRNAIQAQVASLVTNQIQLFASTCSTGAAAVGAVLKYIAIGY